MEVNRNVCWSGSNLPRGIGVDILVVTLFQMHALAKELV